MYPIKQCSACGKSAEFYHIKHSKCIECTKKARVERYHTKEKFLPAKPRPKVHRTINPNYYLENKEARKAYQRQYNALNAEEIAQRNREWQEKNPEKAKAHRLVYNAVKSGKLIKPPYCTLCGQHFPKQEIHAHHQDYTKPLAVVWCCSLCHQRTFHRGTRQ